MLQSQKMKCKCYRGTPIQTQPEFHPITSSCYSPSVRGENDSKQSNEIQDNSDLP